MKRATLFIGMFLLTLGLASCDEFLTESDDNTAETVSQTPKVEQTIETLYTAEEFISFCNDNKINESDKGKATAKCSELLTPHIDKLEALVEAYGKQDPNSIESAITIAQITSTLDDIELFADFDEFIPSETAERLDKIVSKLE